MKLRIPSKILLDLLENKKHRIFPPGFRNRRPLSLFYFLTSLLFCFILLSINCKKKNNYPITTGLEGGTYYQFAKSMNDLPSFEFDVLKSEGSIDNINFISEKKAKLGLCQLDILQNAFIGNQKAKDNVKVILPLYNEEAHIIARKEIKSLKDLFGKKVSIGPDDSGNKITSLMFLGFTGLHAGHLTFLELNTDVALEKLRKNELDAVIIIAGAPVKILSSIPESDKDSIHLIEFTDGIYDSLSQGSLYYKKAEIPANTYKWQKEAVKTVSVTSVLIGSSDIKDEEALSLSLEIYENIEILSKKHEKWKSINKSQLRDLHQRNPDLFHPYINKMIF